VGRVFKKNAVYLLIEDERRPFILQEGEWVEGGQERSDTMEDTSEEKKEAEEYT